MAQTEERFDPLLMAVLSRRIEAIIREMSNTVMRASRSAVITNARDMSCGILTYDHRLISVEEAMPIHVSALELTTRPITELFDDVKEGDAFFNNSPYHGVTHHADMTLCVPVFAEGEPLFWVLSRSHHADVGAPEPTTYLPYAATLYQEGVHFPCVRIQENREDKADIVRIGLQKIRAPNVWYGDYRAQVGACRNGERRLKALVEHYGIGTVRAFVEAWMDYGARRAAAAIRELPAGTWRYTCTHDPIPGVAEEGIPITAQVTIEPDDGFITVDLRDNPDCVPGGVNLSEACAAGSCRIGVFYNLDPTIPHNDGSASRIEVLLRDGCVVGRPTFPAGTSVATTNVNDRLINAVQCCFAQIGAPHGLAEGGGNFSAGLGVISGIDDRDGEPVPYVNQFCTGLSGGPGTHGHDGWLTYEAPDGGGVLVLASIEIDEAQYPMDWTPPPDGIESCQGGDGINATRKEKASMDQASIIGIDLAKHSFQVHGARADGSVAFRKKLSRGKVLDFLASQPPCVVAMEACGSAHHWGREAEKLGHEVKLVPPIYVKPFVKRQKNDMADAEATTEAAQRPTMSFVAVKTEEQQARGMLFRTRDLLVRQRTQTINALRGHLAEFGVIAPQGPAHVSRLASALEDPCSGLPEQVRELAGLLLEQIAGLDEKIRGLEKDVHTSARQDEEAVRLMTIPGVGPITAMALQAFAPPMESFRRGRDFSAWLGLVPRQHTTGGKPRLGKISKMGQRDLRRLLITGAMSVVRNAARRGETTDPWLASMLARKPRMLVAVALANRMARITWALTTKKENYRAPGIA